MKKLSLYVHIPFCEKKCSYCDFVSFTDKKEQTANYITALLKEAKLQAPKFKDNYQISTLFIGGGTPSYLPDGLVEHLICELKKLYNFSQYAEISIESNPNSLTLKKLKEYRQAGVNRLSIGGQSINDKLLAGVGRVHTFADLDKAIKNAKAAGFTNINVDIMLGLPNQKLRDVDATLKYLIKNKIKHISAYSLILEDDTPLKDMVDKGLTKLPSEDDTVKMYNHCLNFLRSKGMIRYEVSNFAYPDYECRHNVNYWELGQYLGLGVNASSFLDYDRFKNTKSFDEYMQKISSGVVPVGEKEHLSITELKEEMLFLGLRTAKGILIKNYNNRFNANLLYEKEKELKYLIGNKLMKLENEHLRINDNAFYVMDTIIKKLI